MRISLIVAILAALAAGTMNIIQVRQKINTLMTQRDDYHSQRDQVQAKLDTTTRELTSTKNELTLTKQQLADAQTARKKAEETAAAEKKRADDLSDRLTKVTAERDDAQAQLAAYKATGKTPKEVADLVNQIKQDDETIKSINAEKEVLARSEARWKSKYQELVGISHVVTLRADLKGQVVVVDPKWDFVVVNVGEDQGVLPDGELLVSRNGKLVAKVIIRRVEKDRSIANVVPGWKLGEIFEGDVVTPAHPAT